MWADCIWGGGRRAEIFLSGAETRLKNPPPLSKIVSPHMRACLIRGRNILFRTFSRHMPLIPHGSSHLWCRFKPEYSLSLSGTTLELKTRIIQLNYSNIKSVKDQDWPSPIGLRVKRVSTFLMIHWRRWWYKNVRGFGYNP